MDHGPWRGARRIAGTAIVVLVVSGALTARSDHVDSMYRNPGQPDCREGSPRQDVCRTDDTDYTWYLNSGYSADMLNAAISAMNGWGTTDVNVRRESSLSYLITEAHFWPDTSLSGTSTLGNTDCLVAVGRTRCGAYQVRIRPDVYSGGYNLAKALICHEAGHTLGLLHGGQANPGLSNQNATLGCMRTQPLTGDMRFPGPHNIAEINRSY